MLASIMPSAKRVLLLVTQADWGGVQSFLCRFASQLREDGVTVLLAAGGEGELWAEARRLGIPCHQLRHVVRDISPIQDLLAIFEIQRLIAEFQPDAIHLNSSKIGVLGSLAAANSPRDHRVVYRIGGWSFLDPQPEWKRWIYRTAERLTARFKDVIITVHPGDEALANKLHFHPRERVMTVPNGLNLAAYLPTLLTRHDARAQLGLAEHQFVFGTVANAYATKGLLDYLDAIEKFTAKDRGVQFVIIGDGPEFAALTKKRDALNLQDRVLLAGRREDADTLYPAFDAFVLPSKKEGMPWTLLEAMAAGLPCIATDVGACSWVLNHQGTFCGTIVPPNDRTSLIEALRTIKNDRSLREHYSRSSRQCVQDRFTWNVTYSGNCDALGL